LDINTTTRTTTVTTKARKDNKTVQVLLKWTPR